MLIRNYCAFCTAQPSLQAGAQFMRNLNKDQTSNTKTLKAEMFNTYNRFPGLCADANLISYGSYKRLLPNWTGTEFHYWKVTYDMQRNTIKSYLLNYHSNLPWQGTKNSKPRLGTETSKVCPKTSNLSLTLKKSPPTDTNNIQVTLQEHTKQFLQVHLMKITEKCPGNRGFLPVMIIIFTPKSVVLQLLS